MTSGNVATAALGIFLACLATWAARRARRTGQIYQSVLVFVFVGLTAFWGVAALLVAGSRP